MLLFLLLMALLALSSAQDTVDSTVFEDPLEWPETLGEEEENLQLLNDEFVEETPEESQFEPQREHGVQPGKKDKSGKTGLGQHRRLRSQDDQEGQESSDSRGGQGGQRGKDHQGGQGNEGCKGGKGGPGGQKGQGGHDVQRGQSGRSDQGGQHGDQ